MSLVETTQTLVCNKNSVWACCRDCLIHTHSACLEHNVTQLEMCCFSTDSCKWKRDPLIYFQNTFKHYRRSILMYYPQIRWKLDEASTTSWLMSFVAYMSWGCRARLGLLRATPLSVHHFCNCDNDIIDYIILVLAIKSLSKPFKCLCAFKSCHNSPAL